MNRRRALTLIGTVGVTGMAGCLGEDGNFEYAASPAIISAASDAGYQADGPKSIGFNEPIELAGISQDVHIETWSAAYASQDTQTGVFLFSTPDVTVAGISANPLAQLSGVDLIVRVIEEGLGQAGGDTAIENVEQETELTLSVLGEERTMPVFSAVLDIGSGETPQFGGAGGTSGGQPETNGDGKMPIQLYLLSFTHGEDVLLAIGIHPQTADAREEVVSLLESIEHPIEVSSESTTP